MAGLPDRRTVQLSWILRPTVRSPPHTSARVLEPSSPLTSPGSSPAQTRPGLLRLWAQGNNFQSNRSRFSSRPVQNPGQQRQTFSLQPIFRHQQFFCRLFFPFPRLSYQFLSCISQVGGLRSVD